MRAQRTAALAGLHVNAIVDDLAEWAYGDYEGITSKEIHQTNPGWSIFTMGAPGGESPEDVAAPLRPGAGQGEGQAPQG